MTNASFSLGEGLRPLLEGLMDLIDELGVSLNFSPTASDSEFVPSQVSQLDSSAEALMDVIGAARVVLAGARDVEDVVEDGYRAVAGGGVISTDLSSIGDGGDEVLVESVGGGTVVADPGSLVESDGSGEGFSRVVLSTDAGSYADVGSRGPVRSSGAESAAPGTGTFGSNDRVTIPTGTESATSGTGNGTSTSTGTSESGRVTIPTGTESSTPGTGNATSTSTGTSESGRVTIPTGTENESASTGTSNTGRVHIPTGTESATPTTGNDTPTTADTSNNNRVHIPTGTESTTPTPNTTPQDPLNTQPTPTQRIHIPTDLNSPTTTTLSNTETHLSTNDNNTTTNKYIGYTGNDNHTTGADHLDKPTNNGYLASEKQLHQISNLVDNMSYGPEIFESIYVIDEPQDYGGFYLDDGAGDYYTYGDYNGDTMTMIGEPVDVGPLSVDEVDYTRPQDMTLSDEEINACIAEVLARGGVDDPIAQEKWAATLRLIAEHESSFNPAAGNNWDSNAIGATQVDGLPAQASRGLMQTIPSTFAANHMAGTSNSIYDPVASMGAAFIYLQNRYGCDIYGNGLDEFYSARTPAYHGY